MDNLIAMGGTALMILFAVLAIGVVFARLYRRATKEMAFVRTGLGGQKVIMDGGAVVFPVFHELIMVNMNTLKLEVQRRAKESLITKDRMRVDVTAAFFVRVKQSDEAISTAAQTLGSRTLSPEELKTLVEDKFVDALRSAAATMTIQELQDKRREFVQAVQNAVAEDLEKNGLELESVSLTSLDQTSKEYFNPENTFDAEGLTRLTEQTENRRKERNAIEQDTAVDVSRKNLAATQQQLALKQEEEFATMEQRKRIAMQKAEQDALVATEQAQRTREAEEARIESERQVRQKTITAAREVEAAELEKNQVLSTKQIEQDRSIETARTEQKRAVELARQDTQIALANKSREQLEADAQAAEARAKTVTAEEAVITAKAVAVANRDKDIQLIDAERQAEMQAVGVKVLAEAEKGAAHDRAEATRTLADAQRAAAMAEAEGKRALNDALNTLSPEQIQLQLKTLLLQNLPAIVEAMARPMENIDSIKIIDVQGLQQGGSARGGQGGEAAVEGSGNSPTFPEQVVNAALRYQVSRPLMDQLMGEVGLNNQGMTGLSQSLANMAVLTPGASTGAPKPAKSVNKPLD